MDTNVRGDVVAFDDLDLTIAPGALQIQIIGALPTDVAFANVILESKSVRWSKDSATDVGGSSHKAPQRWQHVQCIQPTGRQRSLVRRSEG